VKAAVVRKLALERTVDELQAGAEAIAEREEDVLGVDGDDLGEKLTHVMLAIRVRGRIDAGEDPKVAFRTEMASVRELLENESPD
jgi:hypothetical protein